MDTPNYFATLPFSGQPEVSHTTLTYDNNTEWYYLEEPYPRFRSLGQAVSIYDFHRNMYETLKILDSGIAYVPAYPSYLLENETESIVSNIKTTPKTIITYQTVQAEPGSLNGQPFGKPKEIKPRIREQLFLDPLFRKDIDSQAENLKYYRSTGQWFDNLVQFDLWSKTNYEAENSMDWFEDVLFKYQGMFKELGISEMKYYKRVRDDTLIKWKNKFSVRSLIYYFRTEKVHITEIRPIKRISITVTVNTKETLYPADRLFTEENKIIGKWLKNGGK